MSHVRSTSTTQSGPVLQVPRSHLAASETRGMYRHTKLAAAVVAQLLRGLHGEELRLPT